MSDNTGNELHYYADTEENRKKLRLCPFCGRLPHIRQEDRLGRKNPPNYDYWDYYIECRHDDMYQTVLRVESKECQMYYGASSDALKIQKAIDVWNDLVGGEEE